MNILEAREIRLSLPGSSGDKNILESISFSVEKGETFVVLGASGSGKSSLAHALGLLAPVSGGSFRICGCEGTWQNRDAIRRRLGILLQNAEDSFLSAYLEEELLYAPLAQGMGAQRAGELAAKALELCRLVDHRHHSPQLLPGDKKRRAALAAAISHGPELLILDEPFAFADRRERSELKAILARLKSEGVSLLVFTNSPEAAAGADHMLLLGEGRALAVGEPRAILSDDALLERAGLLPPFARRVCRDLEQAGISLAGSPVSLEELVDAICR